MKIKNIPPIPAILLAVVSVQGGAAIAKTIFPFMGAMGTASLRIVLSAFILLIVYRPNFKKISKEQWKSVIPYSIVLGAMNISIYLSLARIPLGLAVTLEFIGPLLLAIITSRKALDFLWAMLATIGIILIAPWNSDTNNIDLIGVLLALLAGIFWAAYIVFGSKTSKVMDSGEAVSIGMLVASCIVIPFAIAEGNLVEITPKLFILGVAIALFSSAIPFTLEMNALKHIPAKTFSILISLEPAVAALCGLLFLKEELSIFEWTAILLVIIACAGSTLSKPGRTYSNQ